QSMAQMALRWIQMNPAVTCSIPGGKRADQVANNVAAADLPPLSDATMRALADIYTRYAKPRVHQRW
ncbi:MAG TPA: aldo/keto reductase, partial [Rhodoferax sp.]